METIIQINETGKTYRIYNHKLDVNVNDVIHIPQLNLFNYRVSRISKRFEFDSVSTKPSGLFQNETDVATTGHLNIINKIIITKIE